MISIARIFGASQCCRPENRAQRKMRGGSPEASSTGDEMLTFCGKRSPHQLPHRTSQNPHAPQTCFKQIRIITSSAISGTGSAVQVSWASRVASGPERGRAVLMGQCSRCANPLNCRNCRKTRIIGLRETFRHPDIAENGAGETAPRRASARAAVFGMRVEPAGKITQINITVRGCNPRPLNCIDGLARVRFDPTRRGNRSLAHRVLIREVPAVSPASCADRTRVSAAVNHRRPPGRDNPGSPGDDGRRPRGCRQCQGKIAAPDHSTPAGAAAVEDKVFEISPVAK